MQTIIFDKKTHNLMKSIFATLILTLVFTGAFAQKTGAKKPNTQKFISKYNSFVSQTTEDGFSGTKSSTANRGITVTLKVELQEQDNGKDGILAQFWFKEHLLYSDGLTVDRSGVLDFYPKGAYHEWKYKKVAAFGGGNIYFYRQPVTSGTNWVQDVKVFMNPSDQAEFLKALDLVAKEYKATIAEKDDLIVR